MFKAQINLFILLASSLFARQITVSTSDELISATKNAIAGDTILVAPGEYIGNTETSGDPGNLPNGTGYFWIGNDGTKENPIVVMGTDLSNPPTLKGTTIDKGYVIHITGDYVVLKNLNITQGDKCVMFDHSSHSILENCEVHNSGAELIHVRDSSCAVTISRNKIYNSGNNGGTYGEGLYIGTDQDRWGADDVDSSQWGGKAKTEGYGGYDWRVDSTLVVNNFFSGSISAECMDIKEGTRFTVVKSNMFVGDSIAQKAGAQYYDDSFIDLKGVSATLVNNMFFAGGNSITKYIAEVDRSKYAHIPDTLTADGYASPWCDSGDADDNIGWEIDNEVVDSAIDPRATGTEYFKFFDSGKTSITNSLITNNKLVRITNKNIAVKSNDYYTLKIYSINGMLLREITTNNQTIALHSLNIAKGVYQFSIVQGERKEIGKLVIE